MTDKEMIWEDCPACARKHLSAAYAAVTMPLCGKPVFAHAAEVLVARSIIANREREAGYRGNADLASGCLALAESLPGERQSDIAAWRAARLAPPGAEPEAALAAPSFSAYAGAHIVEALRELPALLDRTAVKRFFTASGDFSPLLETELTDWLRESIKWVKVQYELEAANS